MNDSYDRFESAWDAVQIVRRMEYTLFTFGDSDLPYYLIVNSSEAGQPVEVRRGTIRIARPLIITAMNAEPEVRDFFEDADDESAARFLMARRAEFSRLRLENSSTSRELLSDSVEEIVDRLNQRLDAEEEDRMAILTSPAGLGGIALFRYALDRVMASASSNVQELRERGLLPGM
ncbi:MAG: hypothetical protein DWH91_04565 [Planctomycetota bacterium]|nr:MAG: hypothetical protein DWH91_04565 [Planctomycetota bacterium]